MAEMMTESQEALVRAVKGFAAGRDEVSFEKLYKLTYKKLFAYIQMMSKDKEKTEDVLQNGYLICYRKIDQLSDPTKFMSWMKNICYHELAHSYDDRVTLLTNTQSADEDVDVFDTIRDDKMEMPEKAAEDANLKKLLLKNINMLPEKQRMALIAFYFEDRSIKEIAESMGVPENTVKTYLNRARKSMNDSMKSYADANGLKLVPFAVVPFMAMLFGEHASACELLAGTGSALWNKLRPLLWKGIANGAGASGGAAGTAGTGGAGAAGVNGVAGGIGVGVGAAGATSVGLGIKIAICGLIAVLVGGSVGAFATYKYVDNKRKAEQSEQSDFSENPMDDAKKIIQLEEDPVQVDDTENPSDSADGAEAENKKAEENEKPEENQIPDPHEIWGDTEITEYYDSNLGVHFYLPTELSVSLETPEYWGDAGSLVYVTGMGMNNEYLFATTYVTREVAAGGDAAVADYRMVSDAGGRIYELGFISEYEDPEPTSAALSFRESYADKIAESAYIDPNVEPRYISFSVADTTCEKSDGSYWYEHHAPDWLEGSPSGVKELTVGTDLLAGSYSIYGTFGAGSITVTGADGSEKYSFHDDFSNWESCETLGHWPTIVVEDGDKIKLDADDADCYAITFSDHKGAGASAQGGGLPS
ncbi:RNA polymerase sigma factor, sigma-70 family [Butyrivibrio sp. ob235]|uniref:RNA polymerase sigma factor n=1 Tax=Butyrivibrio sp. ob235 TaxID=1761780 RepID=UPI0008C319E7|nr:sigma-70 family RNA polymerase sigma factor [Butyrivibrio sp. ob235]SEK65804.1 RNA polymerase sigma factor, sigma-70 family [Butyrivibrio sp. ob235]